MFEVKVGLALGGGAARGLAHIGLIEVLRREGIPIDLIAGASMGALVGAMYCAEGSVDRAFKEAPAFLRSKEFSETRIHQLRREFEPADAGMFAAVGQYISKGITYASTVTRASVLNVEDLYELLGFFIDDRDLRSLKVPLRIVATDLADGAPLVLAEGPLIDAVAASSSVPGAFPPIRVGGRLCVDGGIANMVPVSVAFDMGADYVIAGNVIHNLPVPQESMKALHIHFRSHEITKRLLTQQHLRFADRVISPDVGQFHWADFSQADLCIEAGRGAAEKAAAAIKDDLRCLRRTPKFLRRKTGAHVYRMYMSRAFQEAGKENHDVAE